MKPSPTLLAALLLGVNLPVAKAAVIVTALITPLDVHDDLFGHLDPVDLNADGAVDVTLASNFASVGLRTDGLSRVVIKFEPPPNIGGPPIPLLLGYLIGADLLPDLIYAPAWYSTKDINFPDGPHLFVGISSVSSGGDSSTFPREGLRAPIGIEFRAADGIHYGFLDVFANKGYPGLTLYGWAYESEPGRPIQAGLVPEPGTATLLAGSSLLLWQRNASNRKENKSAAANRWGLSVFIAWCRSKVPRVG